MEGDETVQLAQVPVELVEGCSVGIHSLGSTSLGFTFPRHALCSRTGLAVTHVGSGGWRRRGDGEGLHARRTE